MNETIQYKFGYYKKKNIQIVIQLAHIVISPVYRFIFGFKRSHSKVTQYNNIHYKCVKKMLAVHNLRRGTQHVLGHRSPART